MIVGMGVTPECGLRRHHKQQRSMVGGSTRMRWGFVFCVVIIGIALGTARTSAFSSSRATGSRIHLATTPKFRTKASHATPLPPPNANTNTNNALTLLSYGERSRPFRRDLFQYENWVDHRQSNRFGASLLSIFSSGVFQQLLKEIYLTTGIATFICVYNALLVTGYEDFGGVHHEPFWQLGQYVLAVPSIVFTLTSPALSLLLVFKTNTSYQRWDEGRKNWEFIANSCRTIVREGCGWILPTEHIPPSEKQRLLCRLAAAIWCFPRSMTRHLLSADEDEANYATECRENLRPELAQDLIAARHRPTRALYEVSCAINELPLAPWRRITMDKATTVLCDAMGSNERIFTSPIPRAYTRHTARFLEVWLLLMPLTLYDVFSDSWNHWGMIPATIVISFFLTGIEELGLQLEEPFSVLPMHKITNTIGLSAEEHVSWMNRDIADSYDSTTLANSISTGRFGQ